MDRLSIGYRLAICAIALALGVGILSYGFLTYLVKKDLVALQVEGIAHAESVTNMTSSQILALGVDAQNFAEFNKSPIAEQGFIVEDGLNTRLVYALKKQSDRFEVRAKTVDLEGWWKSTSVGVALFLILMSTICGVVVFSLGRYITSPLEFLRKTADDINAGQFQINMEYQADDEVGRLFLALKRLSGELEKKEIVIETANSIASTDGLTGLKNHRAFKEEFRRQLNLTQRHSETLGMIILDVDHFKKFNDQFGHLNGDEVLKFMGAILPLQVRDTDFMARYGGEEFVALLHKPDIQGLAAVAEKIRKAIEAGAVKGVTPGIPPLKVTASLGVLFIDGKNLPPRGELNMAEFIDIADKNLYKAKKLGRNRSIMSEYVRDVKPTA